MIIRFQGADKATMQNLNLRIPIRETIIGVKTPKTIINSPPRKLWILALINSRLMSLSIVRVANGVTIINKPVKTAHLGTFEMWCASISIAPSSFFGTGKKNMRMYQTQMTVNGPKNIVTVILSALPAMLK